MFKTNRFNTIAVKNNIVIKKGPKSLIEGELYFYKNIPQEIFDLFPKLIDSFSSEDTLILHMEMIEGRNLSDLLINKILTVNHLKDISDILIKIHNVSRKNSLSVNNIAEFYEDKFLKRIDLSTKPETNTIKGLLLKLLKTYTDSDRLIIKSVIHGDFWLSNIIITSSGNYKLIDMRGRIGDLLTLEGDPNYDYAKLYQSLLGYDFILYDNIDNYDELYKKSLIDYYKTFLKDHNILLEDISILAIILILGNIPFIESEEKKQLVWNWVLSLITNFA